MDMEDKNESQRACRSLEPEIFLQWGKRKRLRCVRVKDPQVSHKFNRRRILSRFSDKHFFPVSQSNNRFARPENRKSCWSPEKDERCYVTRGSAVSMFDENAKHSGGNSINGEDKKGFVWPRLFITLSNKEKEEDFMAMKGCKPPQRPKRRAKTLQRSLLLVSPGGWLTDMCQERYEVREKKISKKRPRGLKAMGSMESDSE